MAALRRAEDLDQWRLEDLSDRDRERPKARQRDRSYDPRTSSPAPRAGRDSSSHHVPENDTGSSENQRRGRSPDRSLDCHRTRRRSRGASREHRYRGSEREASADRVAHPHRRHHHHHRRDTTPSSSKHHHSRSPSPRGSSKRVKRPRSRSSVRSRSRTRRPDSPGKTTARTHSPRSRPSDRDRAPRPSTPDAYLQSASHRRQSPSIDKHYRPASHRSRKRSISSDRRSRRELSPRALSPRRPDRRSTPPFGHTRERPYKHSSTRDRTRSRSRGPRRVRSRSPPRRRSPASYRRSSPPSSKRARLSPRRSRSPRLPVRRRPSRSPSPAPKSRHRLDQDTELAKSSHTSKRTSRKGSPTPGSGYNSDTSRGRGDDDKMRGAYQYQGRGGFQQSPPYPPHNQYSPQNQSPYHGGRGGWNNQSYPNHGSVFSHVVLMIFKLTLIGLPCTVVILQASRHIIKANPLVITQTSHIPNRDFRILHIEVDMVASAATAFMVPIGGSQVLVGVVPLVLVVGDEALHLRNFPICHGHQRQEHEAVVLPLKRHAHNRLLCRKHQPNPPLSMPMITRSVLPRICVWRMRDQRRRLNPPPRPRHLLQLQQHPNLGLDSRSRPRTQCPLPAKQNSV